MFHNFLFSYDKVGNLTQLQNQVESPEHSPAVISATTLAALNQAFNHDHLTG
jgi:hypothetical protein